MLLVARAILSTAAWDVWQLVRIRLSMHVVGEVFSSLRHCRPAVCPCRTLNAPRLRAHNATQAHASANSGYVWLDGTAVVNAVTMVEVVVRASLRRTHGDYII